MTDAVSTINVLHIFTVCSETTPLQMLCRNALQCLMIHVNGRIAAVFNQNLASFKPPSFSVFHRVVKSRGCYKWSSHTLVLSASFLRPWMWQSRWQDSTVIVSSWHHKVMPTLFAWATVYTPRIAFLTCWVSQRSWDGTIKRHNVEFGTCKCDKIWQGNT